MRLLSFLKREREEKQGEFSVSRMHYDEDSPKLIIYNLGKKSYKSLIINVVNDKGELFRYQIEDLSYRGAVDLNTLDPDMDSKMFSGAIAFVEIRLCNVIEKFKPKGNGRFRLC